MSFIIHLFYKLKSRCYLFILFVFQIFVYHAWFTTNVFINSDYHYYFKSFFLDGLRPNIWMGAYNLGSISSTPWRIPQDYLFGLLSSIGMTMNQIDKILLIWPTLFTMVIAGYIFSFAMTDNKRAAFFGSLVYMSSTYFLAINSQGHFLLTLSTNLGVIGLAVFILAIAQRKSLFFVFSALSLVFSSIADLRPTLIAVVLIAIYTVLNLKLFILSKRDSVYYLLNILIMSIVFLSCSAYYIIPMVFTSSSGGTLARQLFGNNFWKFLPAFTGFHPFWSPANLEWFRANTVQVYFLIIPIITIIAALLVKVSVKKIFLLVVLVIGIFLSKQVAEPFGMVYGFLFSIIPGFGAFRESTKFYPIVTVAYTGMISLLMSYESSSNRLLRPLQIFCAFGIILYSVLNLHPIFTGSIGNLYIPNKLHQDYLKLNGMIEKDADSYRLLWIPGNDRHHVESAKKPSMDVGYLVQFLSNNNNHGYPEENLSSKERVDAFLKQIDIQLLLNNYSIKYIVIPKNDIGDDIFKYYGKDRNYYVKLLRSIKQLEEMDSGFEKINVFRNTNFNNRVSIKTVNGKMLKNILIAHDSGTYEVEYANSEIDPTTDYIVDFSEAYDPNWVLLWHKNEGQDISSVSSRLGLPIGHERTIFGLNKYSIPGSVLQKKSSFSIYFKEQRFLTIGLYISSISAAITLSYILIIYFGTKIKTFWKPKV